MEIPRDSSIAMSSTLQREQNKAEQERLKRLVLDYESREEEADKQGASCALSLSRTSLRWQEEPRLTRSIVDSPQGDARPPRRRAHIRRRCARLSPVMPTPVLLELTVHPSQRTGARASRCRSFPNLPSSPPSPSSTNSVAHLLVVPFSCCTFSSFTSLVRRTGQ